jgi:4-coumarate--CoA ligase
VERNGKFYIVDRKKVRHSLRNILYQRLTHFKELIKYKGLQIAPAEIEGLLIGHSEILEAAVIGVPEDSSENLTVSAIASSEIPRAYVVRAPGSNLSAEDVKRFVAKDLAPYKHLRGGVVFVPDLPRNALNKILRKDLRTQAVAEMRRERGAKL